MQVHGGMGSALETVWEDLQDALEAVGDCNIVFTGHSLGGALALVCTSIFVWFVITLVKPTKICSLSIYIRAE